MANYRIVPSLFFDDQRSFPWDILGYGVPKCGPVHSYVCSILAPLANRYEKPLLEGQPSLREVNRMARACTDAVSNGELQLADFETPFVCTEIYKFCADLYQARSSDRADIAQDVLELLRRFGFYQDWLRDRLDLLWKQGLISIPKEYLELIESPEDKKPRSYY